MKNTREKWTTPRGEVVWAFVERPSPQYGNYSITIAYEEDDPEFLRFKKKVEAAAKAAKEAEIESSSLKGAKLKRLKDATVFCPIKPELDDETGEETGRWLLSAKSAAEYTNKKTGKVVKMDIPIFNAKTERIKGKTGFARGSQVKLRVTVAPFSMISDADKAGVTFYLDAVQLLKLVEYQGGGSDGFDEEDGYDGQGGEASEWDNDNLADAEDVDNNRDF